MNDNITNDFTSYFKQLPKLANYVVGFTLICYLAGFVIANMYLGSFGIVNLDILRTRYIVVGFLFWLFIGAIIYLIYGLFQQIRKHREDSSSKLLSTIISYSFQNLSIIVLSIMAVNVLAGSISSTPTGVPKLSQPIAWASWLSAGLTAGLRMLGFVLTLPVVLLAFVVLIILLINPKGKNEVRASRKQQLVSLFTMIREYSSEKGLSIWLLIALLAFLMTLGIYLLAALSSYSGAGNQGVFVLSGGWGRYLGGISVIYSLVAIFVVGVYFLNKTTEIDRTEPSDDPLNPIAGNIGLISLAVILIMPLYANGIYPNLPQQVGGGQVVKVDLMLSDTHVIPLIQKPESEIYLLDRTSSTTLFLLIDNKTVKYQVAEIPNSYIESIIYSSSP